MYTGRNMDNKSFIEILHTMIAIEERRLQALQDMVLLFTGEDKIAIPEGLKKKLATRQSKDNTTDTSIKRLGDDPARDVFLDAAKADDLQKAALAAADASLKAEGKPDYDTWHKDNLKQALSPCAPAQADIYEDQPFGPDVKIGEETLTLEDIKKKPTIRRKAVSDSDKNEIHQDRATGKIDPEGFPVPAIGARGDSNDARPATKRKREAIAPVFWNDEDDQFLIDSLSLAQPLEVKEIALHLNRTEGAVYQRKHTLIAKKRIKEKRPAYPVNDSLGGFLNEQ